MTSEILIINQNAIALAADSTVTVSNESTYEGVNKLFMLSNDPPMGMMIYGNAHFMNIPMETLINEYNINTIKLKIKPGVKMIDYFKRNTIGPGIEKPEQSPISLSKILAKEGM